MFRGLGALATLALGAAPVAAEAPAPGNAGREVFATQWAFAGASDASGRSGLGPLFNAASCDSCHRNGGHGDGPIGDGPAPVALVITLASPSTVECVDPPGDPVYGRVFNTAAQTGVQPEGVVTVKYREIAGTYYPGGTRWNVRDPEYALVQLSHGPLAPTTVIAPRLAPSLFGLGLLEAVPDAAITGDSTGPDSGGRGSGEPSHLASLAPSRENSARSGPTLFFGAVPAAVLAQSDRSVLFVSSGGRLAETPAIALTGARANAALAGAPGRAASYG